MFNVGVPAACMQYLGPRKSYLASGYLGERGNMCANRPAYGSLIGARSWGIGWGPHHLGGTGLLACMLSYWEPILLGYLSPAAPSN
jgi:hypothetical protein